MKDVYLWADILLQVFSLSNIAGDVQVFIGDKDITSEFDQTQREAFQQEVDEANTDGPVQVDSCVPKGD